MKIDITRLQKEKVIRACLKMDEKSASFYKSRREMEDIQYFSKGVLPRMPLGYESVPNEYAISELK